MANLTERPTPDTVLYWGSHPERGLDDAERQSEIPWQARWSFRIEAE